MTSPRAETHAPGWSLRNRLLLIGAVATVVAWIAGGATVYLVGAEESEHLFDEKMADIGRAVLSFSQHEIEEIRSEGRGIVHVETARTLGPRYKYQIFSASGEPLLLSHDAPRTPLAPLDQAGYVTRTVGGVPMRTCVMWNDARDMAVIVAEPIAYRGTFIGAMHGYLLAMFAGSLPLLLGLNWWMFRRATRSLDESAHQLIDRSPRDLRPVVVDSPPRELAPLIGSMNALFERFENALAAERRLTSAAAHELRTPLAAVKVQAQVAARARNREEAARALGNLATCVDRASRMVDQLLTLARLDSLSAAPAQHTTLRLDEIVALVIDELAPLIEQHRLQITRSLAPATIEGMEFGVAVLIRNLIDNAARYTPPGGTLRVTTGRRGDHAYAEVEDSGPGIPPQERARVFDRFYRLPSNNVDGCGIGLSIVRTVAHVHRAQVSLDESSLGGLRAVVTFPAPVHLPSPPPSEVGETPPSIGYPLRAP
ncbi:MAG: two-component system sensor histidine kinase PmrB [Burkholderiaceae bacterium]